MAESDETKHALADTRLTALEEQFDRIHANHIKQGTDQANAELKIQAIESYITATKSNMVKATWTIVLSFVATITYFAIAIIEKVGLMQ